MTGKTIARDGKFRRFRAEDAESVGLCGMEFRSRHCNHTWEKAIPGSDCYRCAPNSERREGRGLAISTGRFRPNWAMTTR